MTTNNQKLKIGLDYHGVINKNFSYFSEFCSEARRRGHQIFIITGGPQPKIRQQLNYHKIPYDFIFAISDYYQALGLAKQESSGEFTVPEHLWNIAKGEFCRQNGINFHIDDNAKYGKWFSTNFCLYKNNRLQLTHDINVSMNIEPHKLIYILEDIGAKITFIAWIMNFSIRFLKVHKPIFRLQVTRDYTLWSFNVNCNFNGISKQFLR